jgi:hypothetical protein
MGSTMGAWVGSMHHTPSFGYPSKFLVKIYHFAISLRDFTLFFEFFVFQSCVKLFVLTVWIFI